MSREQDLSKNGNGNSEDVELVLFAKRNMRNFKSIYDKYHNPIFLFVMRRTGEKNICNDICSQVFLKAMQNINKYEDRGYPFSSWLYRIAINEVNQYYREVKKKRTLFIENDALPELLSEVNPVNKELKLNLLEDTLKQLNEKEMQLIVLRYFDKKPFNEVASILGISENNAKVKMYRLISKLNIRMNKKIKSL